MSNFENLRQYLLKKRYDIKYLGKMSIMELVGFIVNLLVFPAIFFQMKTTFVRKESADFNPFFILLQLFGGAPEGMIGAIIGYLNNNTQMMIIGFYAMFYNAFMLFFRMFGKNGIVKALF